MMFARRSRMIRDNRLRPSLSRIIRDLQIFIIGLVALVLLGGVMTSQPATAQVRKPQAAGRERALQATVLILVPDNDGDLFSSGSGTVMDAEQGYILTNFHVVGDKPSRTLYNDEGTAIIGLMPANLRGAPILKYAATFVAGDPELDLAVLKVSGLFDDVRAQLPKNLGLTAVERADSEQLMIGDELFVIGYPGLGGNTVTMSTGVVSGFLDDDDDGVFEWIKTDAEVNRGNSGGLATNSNWEFVGVPSAGVADMQVAGKISLIRTGNLALQFYEAALVGDINGTTGGGARITSVEFGEGINRRNQVTQPAVRFDSGITDLYASFAYEDFRNGQELTFIWYANGDQNASDSFAWNEGESGRSWVSLSNEDGLDDGLYELELILENQSLYRGGITVGEAAQSACNFGPITFAPSIDDAGKPVDPGATFGTVNIVYAVFPVAGMSNGTPWKTMWYYEEQVVLEDDAVWNLGDVDAQWVSLSHPDGLPEGVFKLELYCNGQLVQSSTFEVADRSTRRSNTTDVIGTVYDVDNKRRRVEGALILFLNPGVSIQEWVDADFSDEMVFATGTSNDDGEYRLSAKVTRAERYSIVAIHDDYEPASQDAFLVPADATDPYPIDISMQRK